MSCHTAAGNRTRVLCKSSKRSSPPSRSSGHHAFRLQRPGFNQMKGLGVLTLAFLSPDVPRISTATKRSILDRVELGRRKQVSQRAGDLHKKLKVKAPSWGTDGTRRACMGRDCRSGAGRLHAAVHLCRFRKWYPATGSRGLEDGPLRPEPSPECPPAVLWHAFLLSGTLP